MTIQFVPKEIKTFKKYIMERLEPKYEKIAHAIVSILFGVMLSIIPLMLNDNLAQILLDTWFVPLPIIGFIGIIFIYWLKWISSCKNTKIQNKKDEFMYNRINKLFPMSAKYLLDKNGCYDPKYHCRTLKYKIAVNMEIVFNYEDIILYTPDYFIKIYLNEDTVRVHDEIYKVYKTKKEVMPIIAGIDKQILNLAIMHEDENVKKVKDNLSNLALLLE